MKKIALSLLFVFVMLLFIPNTFALSADSSELLNRSVCSKYEVALANSNGSLTSVGCYDTYQLAKNYMNSQMDKNLTILERVNSRTRVVDAKYALVYLNQSSKVTTSVYSSNKLTTELTYMNNSSYFGGTDAAFLGFDYNYRTVKIKIGGLIGWISNKAYNHMIVPLSWVKTCSHYKISDNGIDHYYAGNIQNSGYERMNYSLGPKANSNISEIENGNYYSYDGIYFYKKLDDMLDDYKSNSNSLSVNASNPYYNYYMYLPHRSKTNYDVDDLDNYIRYDLKFIGSVYGKSRVSGYSTLYGVSDYFMNAEKLYGANAISVFGLAVNESDRGRSDIAVNKNNIFGHEAYDSNPFASAAGYIDVRSNIYYHAYSYINYGYSKVSDYRYHGGHFGNKYSGMNVMYASDVYWGEKASSYYYSFDKDGGMLDYNYYQLILSTTEGVSALISPNNDSYSPYTIKSKGLPFILIEEVEGEEINGNNIWYKIQSDSNLDANGEVVSANNLTLPPYNWDSYVYVHSSYFIKINNAVNENGKYNAPIDIIKSSTDDYTYKTYATKTEYTPKVGKVLENIDYYYSSSLINKAGSILKDSFVTILEEAVSEDSTCYLVITDYEKYQRYWISSENISIVNKDLLIVNLSTSGSNIGVYDKPNGNKVASVYTDNQIPIVDEKEVSGKNYLKVQYKNVNTISYGYVDTTISGITYTVDHLDKPPVISTNEFDLLINSDYNLLLYATGTDNEDGNITSSITISESNVDITKVGAYTVTYSLTDSFGNNVVKTVNVNVKLPEKKTELFMYNSLLHKENNVFTISGFMAIKGMDNKIVSHELVFVNQVTNVEYSFNLLNWQEYPYEMSSLDDDKRYDYSGGWFKSDLDLSLSNIPNGDYTLYIKALNGIYEASSLFTNIGYMDMTRRAVGDDREFLIEIDYTTLNSPLLFSIRDSLISVDIPNAIDPMYNFFNQISLDNSNLTIKGTSHSIGVNFGINDDVSRSLIFENIDNFSRYTFDLGSVTNGDYPITLAVSDNCDKTKAWYNKIIDISTIPVGKYAVYISNTVDGKTYHGELIDVMYTNFLNVNNDRYVFSRNNNSRLRLELTVKE